jgi:hypothetical protein
MRNLRDILHVTKWIMFHMLLDIVLKVGLMGAVPSNYVVSLL